MRRWDRAGSRIPQLIAAASLVCLGCTASAGVAGREEFRVATAPVSYVGVSDTLPGDIQMETLVSPYRDQLSAEMSRVVGHAVAPFEKARPEGALGNLVADAMLSIVQTHVSDTVHIAVSNNGGIRVPISAGPVTVGKIFEVAPFDNYLAVVELSGTELQSLANDIARVGGEPIAGFSFHIDGATGLAGGIRIGNAPLRENDRYRIVTLDYLLDGGDAMRTLWEARPRMTTTVMLRDAIIQFVAQSDEMRPRLDDRIVPVAR